MEEANRTTGTLGIHAELSVKSIKRSRRHSRKALALLHPLSCVSTSRRVLPSQRRPHFFRWHRSRDCAKKIARGRESYRGDTCVRVVIDARCGCIVLLRVTAVFFVGVGLIRVGGHFARKRTAFAIGWIAYLIVSLVHDRGYVSRKKRERDECNV